MQLCEKVVLYFGNFCEYIFMFGGAYGWKKWIIHNFNKYCIFPKKLAFFQCQNNDSGMLDFMNLWLNKVAYNIFQIPKLFNNTFLAISFNFFPLTVYNINNGIDVL